MSVAVASSSAIDLSSSAPRRKSGRVVKKPELFAASSPVGSAKRKRTDESDNEVDAADSISEEEPEESSEGEPDEEELREKRRKSKNKSAARKPAPKKPKTNGETMSLAMRPAKPKASKPKKPRKVPARKSAIADDAEGLYGWLPSDVQRKTLTVLQLKFSRVETTSRMSPRNGLRAFTRTRRKLWPK
jgi:cohesin complex subunit SA-1/2